MFDNIFPIIDPVNVFAIVMLVILITPVLMKKLKMPELIGLIFAGIILGPKGFHVLEKDASIILFGTVGILYIMFYSGLEINMNDFKKKSHKSLIFGMLSFLLPQLVGTFTAVKLMGLNLPAAILLASMYASHTLLSYPAVSKIGAKDDESVMVTIGGTLVTNSISLIILAVTISSHSRELNGMFWIKMPVSLTIFVVLLMFLIPKIARWFFKNSETESISHFILVMAIVFVTASLSKVAGLEPIIGAFLAGLAINTLIPTNSLLMSRIEFVGNALFVPFFLIYVGMIVDVKVFFIGFEAIKVTLIMTVTAVTMKWLAAYITQKILKYSKDQRNLIFGLSNAQAANTLAAVLVGYNLEIFNIHILNGTIGMILITCLISVIVTEKSARKIVLNKFEKRKEEVTRKYSDEKILVPLCNPKTVQSLVDLSILIKKSDNKEPIHPLIIVTDSKNAEVELKEKQKLLDLASKHASSTSNITKLISRIDINPANGILMVMKELEITHLVMGWNGKINRSARLFGTALDHILEKSTNILFVAKVSMAWNLMKRTILVLPKNAEIELGFFDAIVSILNLSRNIKTPMMVFGTKKQFEIIKSICLKADISVEIKLKELPNIYKNLKSELKQYDLPIIYSTRKGSLIYTSEWDVLPKHLTEVHPEDNFIVVYPQICNDDERLNLIR